MAFISKVPAVLAVSSAFLITACGGGGGGSGESAPPPSSTVNSTNASDVAAKSYSSSASLNNQASIGADLAVGVSVQTEATQATGLIDASIQQLYRALKVKPANMAVGVEGSDTVPCSGGGSLSVSFRVTDPYSISSGDRVTITGNQCVEGTTTMNGGLTITFTNLIGDPDSSYAWSATMAMAFNNFAVTENSITATAKGDMTIAYEHLVSGTDKFSASGNSLQMSTTKSGSTTVTQALSSYTYAGSEDIYGLYTYNSNLTVAGDLPRIGNNVLYTVKTLTDFKQQGLANPHQGVMKVTATDNTSLTLTVLNNTSVEIGIDKNGDGSIDETITKTWTELNGLI